MKLNLLAQMFFLLIVFHQKVEWDPEMKKKRCFGTPCGVWSCLLTLSFRTTQFDGFLDYLGLSHFLVTYFSR